MLTLPTSWQTALEERPGGLRAFVVYELILKAGTLRYSPIEVTWGGNAYTRLAVAQRPIIEDMGARIPETKVVFSNAEHGLRPYLTPVDLLSNKRLVARMLAYIDDELDTESLVLHTGQIERPRIIDETTFELTSVGILKGVVGTTPARPLIRGCTVSEYADGGPPDGDCGYDLATGSTTTSGAYSGSGGQTIIAVTDSAQFLEEIARIPTGGAFLVNVGSNTGLTCVGVGESPDNITVNIEVSGADAEVVAFAACPDRSWLACQARERDPEFQGFRGLQLSRTTKYAQVLFDDPRFASAQDRRAVALSGFAQLDSDRQANLSRVPIVYGRRIVPGIEIERTTFVWTILDVNVKNQQAQTYILSEGEIASVENWWVNGEPGQDINQTLDGDVYRTIGLLYRVGGIGVAGLEDGAAYAASSARLRPQKADAFTSRTLNTLSRTAYATFLSRLGTEQPGGPVEGFDIKGIKCKRFSASGELGSAPDELSSIEPVMWMRADDMVDPGATDGNNTGTLPLPEHSGNFPNGWLIRSGTLGVIFHAADGANPVNGHAWYEQPATECDLALTGTSAEDSSTQLTGDFTFACIYYPNTSDVHANWILGRKRTGSKVNGVAGSIKTATGNLWIATEVIDDTPSGVPYPSCTGLAWRVCIIRRTGSLIEFFGTDDSDVMATFGAGITDSGMVTMDGLFSAKNGTEADPGLGCAEAFGATGAISDTELAELYNYFATRYGLEQIESKAWNPNPIWQAVDIALSKTYGAGRIISEADLDFATIKPEADVCDALRASGPVAQVTDYLLWESVYGDRYYYTVDDVSDFEVGMPVLYNGPGYDDDPDIVLGIIPQMQRVQLGVDRTAAWTSSDTISAENLLPTYESHIVLDRAQRIDRSVELILNSCRGFVTYDELGRLQFRVERAITETGMVFADINPVQGYGIKRGSFRWLVDKMSLSKVTNTLLYTYLKHDKENDVVQVADYDDIAEHGMRPGEFTNHGVNNRWQAARLADLEFAKLRTLGTGAELTVGPIGLALQPGDRIKLTHAVPGWVEADKRVTRIERMGLGHNDELCVKLTVEDYVATVYDDVAPIPGEVPETGSLPGLTLTATFPTGGKVYLSWVFDSDSDFPDVTAFEVFRDTSPMQTTSDPDKRIAVIPLDGPTPSGELTYVVPGNLLGLTLYFRVAAVLSPGRIVSNEVSGESILTDPTTTQYTSTVPYNAGGDFDGNDGWTEDVPSFTFDRPETHGYTGGFDGTWTAPGDAYNTDINDTAYATVTGGQVKEMYMTWTTAGAAVGRFKFRAFGTGDGRTEVWLSTDDGATYFHSMTWSTFGVLTYVNSGFLIEQGGDRTKIRVSIRAISHGGSYTSYVYDTQFERESSSAPYAYLANGTAILLGDGASAYGEIARPYPGLTGDWSIPFNLVPGQDYTVQIQARVISDASATSPLLVSLRNIDTNVYTDILTVPQTSIGGSWRIFCGLYTAPSAILGPFQIIARTLNSSDRMQVDRLMVGHGENIYQFTHHPDEVDKILNFPNGKPQPLLPEGKWLAGVIREAYVV